MLMNSIRVRSLAATLGLMFAVLACCSPAFAGGGRRFHGGHGGHGGGPIRGGAIRNGGIRAGAIPSGAIRGGAIRGGAVRHAPGLRHGPAGGRGNLAAGLIPSILANSLVGAGGGQGDGDDDCPAGGGMDESEPAERATADLVSDARRLFKNRDYAGARQQMDEALEREPRNSELMQFQSLILFAQADYQAAAATAYSALTMGRSLDWNAIRQLYPSPQEYTESYYRLSAMAKETTDQPSLQFLLGYHHLMLGHQQHGRRALQNAQKLLPQDELIPVLLSQLPADPSQPPTPARNSTATDNEEAASRNE